MDVHELKEMFLNKKQYEMNDFNELLDFASQSYVKNEISVKQYRDLMKELEELGAHIPHRENISETVK